MAFQLNAATIHYQATDLVDTTAGEDLWQYTYTVSEHSFSMDTGFSIFFDPARYSELQNPAPMVNTNWDILTLAPNPFTPSDGIYDALALVDNPSLLTAFSIDFIWSGIQTPGAQLFELYDASFNVIASGNTFNDITRVSETSNSLLIVSGLLMLGYRKRKAIYLSKISNPQEVCI